MNFKKLIVLSCLMSTPASAAIVVKGLDALSIEEQDQVFGTLIKPKHDVENIEKIQTDLAILLPGKVLTAYWLPDTLYQVIQSFYDIGGVDGRGNHQAKQTTNLNPKYVKTHGHFKHPNYPTTLEEHIACSPDVIHHWVRVNTNVFEKLEAANFQTVGFQGVLTKILREGPLHQNGRDGRRGVLRDPIKQTSYLGKNTELLKQALKVEIKAHEEEKILFWRFSNPLADNIPDLPFTVQGNSLTNTLAAPLEYFSDLYTASCPRVSYGARLLDAFFGDGEISETPYSRDDIPSCTFSFVANAEALLAKGQHAPLPIVYSLALTPEKVKELQDKFYLYYPRIAMPQNLGLYGTDEAFHPSWLQDNQDQQVVETWLELMQSDALQVHYSQGILHEDVKHNAEAQRWRGIYEKFLQKVKTDGIGPNNNRQPIPEPQPPVETPPVVPPVVTTSTNTETPPPSAAKPPKKAARVKKAPKINAQKVKTPKVKVPKIKAQKIKTPKVRAQKVKVQKVKTSKVKPKKIKTPKKPTPVKKTPQKVGRKKR